MNELKLLQALKALTPEQRSRFLAGLSAIGLPAPLVEATRRLLSH